MHARIAKVWERFAVGTPGLEPGYDWGLKPVRLPFTPRPHGAPPRIRTENLRVLSATPLPVGLEGRRCRSQDLNLHWMRPQRIASTVGLDRHSAPGRIRTSKSPRLRRPPLPVWPQGHSLSREKDDGPLN